MKKIIKIIRKAAPFLEFFLRQSSFFTYNSGHRKVFFPGCSLASGNIRLTLSVYSFLQHLDPNTGILLECCGSPIQKFVGGKVAKQTNMAISNSIKERGITELIVPCGNCYIQFDLLREDFPCLRVTSLYDILAEHNWDIPEQQGLIVHHPCSARENNSFRQSFYNLADQAGIETANKNTNRYPLSCCLTTGETVNRQIESVSDMKLLTYCGHCTKKFQKDLSMHHILQYLFNNTSSFTPATKIATFARYRAFRKKLKSM